MYTGSLLNVETSLNEGKFSTSISMNFWLDLFDYVINVVIEELNFSVNTVPA